MIDRVLNQGSWQYSTLEDGMISRKSSVAPSQSLYKFLLGKPFLLCADAEAWTLSATGSTTRGSTANGSPANGRPAPVQPKASVRVHAKKSGIVATRTYK